jgi:hypothetical protein
MRNYKKLWEIIRNYEKLWENMRKYEKLWENMRNYEKLWETIRNYEKLWEITNSVISIFTFLQIFVYIQSNSKLISLSVFGFDLFNKWQIGI